MTIKDHLPAHTHTQNTLGLAELHTWTTPNGTWTITQSLLGTGTAITGPGIRAALGVDQGSDDQVIALLRLLGAIDPAPRRTVATEELITDLQQHLDDNHDPYSGPLTSHDAARIMISWLQQAGDGQAMARILTERARDQKAVRDRLSATHSPETPHEASGGQSEHQDASETPPEASKAEVVDPQQIQIRFDGDAPTGQRVADLLQRIIDTRSQPARAIPMPIVLSDAEADHLLSDIEAAALLQEASKIVPTAAAAYGATTEWCERIEGWTERYKTWIENRGGNSSAAGETTPPETGTKLDRGTRSCPRLKPHDRHNWTTTDRTRPEPAENLWHCPGIADRLPLQCATTDGHAAHEWMSRGAMLWCTGNPRKETP